MRLIDANQLRKIFESWLDDIYQTTGGQDETGEAGSIFSCICQLDNAPTIDPVRHGKWMKEPREGVIVVCSECHAGCFNKTNYCPLCGAKMDGE